MTALVILMGNFHSSVAAELEIEHDVVLAPAKLMWRKNPRRHTSVA